jgi:hypothetical protein
LWGFPGHCLSINIITSNTIYLPGTEVQPSPSGAGLAPLHRQTQVVHSNFPLVPLNSELMYTGKPHSGEGDLHTIPSFDDVQNEPDYKFQQKQKKYDI